MNPTGTMTPLGLPNPEMSALGMPMLPEMPSAHMPELPNGTLVTDPSRLLAPTSNADRFGDLNQFFQPIAPDVLTLERPSESTALPVDFQFDTKKAAEQAAFGESFFKWEAKRAADRETRISDMAFNVGWFVLETQMRQDFLSGLLDQADNTSKEKKKYALAA